MKPVLHRRHLLLLGLAALGLAACRRAPEPVRIGFIGGLSGSVAELGVNGRNGALLAVETLNSQGDARYELRVEDDQQDDDKARAALRSLAAQQVAFVVGPMTSSVAVAVLPLAEQEKLVLISPTATSDELSGKADHFFRVASGAAIGARQLADLMLSRGQRRVAVLMDRRNRAYSESFARSFAERLQKAGATVTTELGYDGTNNDFTALAGLLMADKPQAVLLVAGVGDSALASQQLRRLEPAIGLAVTPWAANTRLLQLGGHAVEGCLALQALDLDSTAPTYIAFRQRYRERFGDDPGTPAVQSYEAVMVGAAAWAQQAPGHGLRQALSEPQRRWRGLYSDIVLDANGDTQRPLHVTEVRAGRFVALRP
jgi:branched-chain amino acid transport system substrate-binding protein